VNRNCPRSSGRGGVASLLLKVWLMTSQSKRDSAPQTRAGASTIVVVGGSGGMSGRYREIAAERGLELRHFENRVPNGTRRILGRVAAVIIMVGMVSHSLRDQVKGLVSEDAPVVYLRSASVSALRNAVSALES
jgi:uncharacterized protein DUF2325